MKYHRASVWENLKHGEMAGEPESRLQWIRTDGDEGMRVKKREGKKRQKVVTKAHYMPVEDVSNEAH